MGNYHKNIPITKSTNKNSVLDLVIFKSVIRDPKLYPQSKSHLIKSVPRHIKLAPKRADARVARAVRIRSNGVGRDCCNLPGPDGFRELQGRKKPTRRMVFRVSSNNNAVIALDEFVFIWHNSDA